MALPALPSDWLNYDAKKKLDWFKSKGITADDLTKMGESSEAVEWLINNGLPTGPGILSQGTAEQQQAAVEEAQQISDSVAQQYEAKDRLSDFLDQAASNTGIYEGKQALEEAIANVAGSTSVADKATLYNQLNDNYSDAQIKDAIARVTGRPATDTEWNYLTGAARVQEIAKDPKATVKQKAELYNDLQELFPTQSNQFLNDLINTVAPGQKAGDLKYLAAASDVQDVASGTVQDKARMYNNLLNQGFDAATAANIIKDATGQAQTAKDMGYLTDAARVQNLSTSNDPNAKADFYNELLKRYDPTAIGNLFTDALGKQQSASDMKYLMELAQQRQTAADRQKTAIDAAEKAKQDQRKAAAGSDFKTSAGDTFTTRMQYAPGMGDDRTGTGVALGEESGLRSGYAPYVQRLLERASAEADVDFQKYTGSSPLLESARAGIANLKTPAQFLQGQNLAQAAGIGALDYGKYKPTSFTTGTFANPNFQSNFDTAYGPNIDLNRLKQIGGSTDANEKAQFYRDYMTSADQALRGAADQFIGKQSGSDWNALQGLAGFNFANPATQPVGKAEGGILSLTKKYDGGGNVALGTDIAASGNYDSFTKELPYFGSASNSQNYDPNSRGMIGDMQYRGGRETQAQRDFKLQQEGQMRNMQDMVMRNRQGMGGMGDMGGEIHHAGLDQWGRGGFSGYDPNNPPADGKNIFGGIGPLYDPNNLVGGTGQFNGPTPDPSASTYTSEPTYEGRPPSIPSNPNLQPTNYGGQNITNVQASYMSPYMQGAVEPALREAKRQSEMMGQVNAAKAVGAGAFGGSRQGLMEAERQRNLMTQLGDIQGKGLQEAYTQGLGQFNTEQQRALEAQKLAEESRKTGADIGLRGLDTSIRAAQTLGGLGQQQGYLDLATLKQMADLGQQQQQFDYNEFLRSEKYPYENLTFMKNMLQGLPISSADSYAPGGSSDAFTTFLQALQGMNTLVPGGAEGGLISGIATLGNDD